MVRPRFHKLPAAQKEAILRAARDEFAAHGFSAASLNRIIETAEISKGSMYYYFDGKDDLYAHVVRVELGQLFDDAGPFPIPTDCDRDAFWSTLERYYLRLITTLVASKQRAALARDWLIASTNPALQQVQEELERAALPWFEQTLIAGQKLRAVRKDVPLGLLIAIVFGMGRATDGWLVLEQPDDKALRKLVRLVTSMMRRALEP